MKRKPSPAIAVSLVALFFSAAANASAGIPISGLYRPHHRQTVARFRGRHELSLRQARHGAADWGRATTGVAVSADGCWSGASRTVYCSVQTLGPLKGNVRVWPVVVFLMSQRRLLKVNYENANAPFYEKLKA